MALASYCSDSEGGETINVQPLGVINSFLNNLINGIEPIQEDDTEENTERVSLKDYYRLNLPWNKIGRKSDATLIRELEEAGFKV